MLTVENLSVYYGAVEALKNVSFSVPPGSIVALVGANGAGKTTVMRALSGLIPTRGGRVRFQGQELTGLPSHQIVSLGLAHSPEGRMVFNDFTVLQNLHMGAFSRSLTKKALAAELKTLFQLFPRLEERQGQPAVLLSGGEQQMLSIARALMAKPKLLLLDEPSLGVAPLLTQQIFEKVRELNAKEGLTVLIAEQNAHMALEMAHYGYVLEVGHLSQGGEASQLLQDPAVQRAYLGG